MIPEAPVSVPVILGGALPHPEAFGVHPIILGTAVVLVPVSL